MPFCNTYFLYEYIFIVFCMVCMTMHHSRGDGRRAILEPKVSCLLVLFAVWRVCFWVCVSVCVCVCMCVCVCVSVCECVCERESWGRTWVTKHWLVAGSRVSPFLLFSRCAVNPLRVGSVREQQNYWSRHFVFCSFAFFYTTVLLSCMSPLNAYKLFQLKKKKKKKNITTTQHFWNLKH